MNELQIGDRVEAVVDNPYYIEYIFAGDTGTICNFSQGRVGVAWDKRFKGGHTCNNQCEIGHGWYVLRSHIKIHEDECIMEDIDENSFVEIILQSAR